MDPDTGPANADGIRKQVPKSPLALFLAFSVLALQGFGGVIAVAQRVLVEQRRWLDREEFLEGMIAIAQRASQRVAELYAVHQESSIDVQMKRPGDPVTRGLDRILQARIPGAKGQPHTRVRGGHFLQEDSGPELADRLVKWMASLP